VRSAQQRTGPAPAIAQEKRRLEERLWSQVVAVASGLPANVVAVWSQLDDPTPSSDPVIGPLSCGLLAHREGFEPPTARSVGWWRSSPQFNWLALNVGYLSVMTVSGVNVPVDFWPGPVQAVANLLPVTHGLLAVRQVLDGGSLAAAAPQVGAELLVAAGWLAASWLSYHRFFRRARITGSFDVG
jgi:hypothetical protein